MIPRNIQWRADFVGAVSRLIECIGECNCSDDYKRISKNMGYVKADPNCHYHLYKEYIDELKYMIEKGSSNY